jgi:hypothetical protein
MKRYLNVALSLLLIASVALLSSCGDDDPKPKSKTELISAHVWKITKLKVDGQEGEPETCDKDDEFTFEADGDYKEVENVKCEPDDAASTTGTWQFKSNETVVAVSISDSGFTITLDKEIVELTETTLKVRYTILGFAVEETYSPK